MNQTLFAGSAGLFLLFAAGGVLVAQETPLGGAREARAADGITIDQAIQNATAEVREYNEHLSFLGHPFLEGRLPGTRGMEIAKDYVESYFIRAGLEPAHVDANGAPTFRQDFTISTQLELASQSMSVGDWTLAPGRQFTALSLGGGGAVNAPAVFVGYSIAKGMQEYSSYADGDDLTGKIAVMLRFEPMNEEGKSLWNERRWSRQSGYRVKVEDAVERGAIGVVVINTPGATDERAGMLPEFASGSQRVDIPVVAITTEAGHELLRRIGPAGTSLMDLRRAADAGRIIQPLEGGTIALNVEAKKNALIGQNISGLVRGKGALANEIVVIGAHLDHLGMGEFGSRERDNVPRLHPGADDNASGSAAMIMLAERFVRHYAALPEGASARTVLIQCYDAEESGLIGARYYTNNPIRPIGDHVLMLNFDMIGRLVDRRLAVSGLGTGTGLKEFVQPHLDATPLTIVPSDSAPAASDHWPFYQAKVPVLFAICDPFHDDYHTSRDTIDKINRVDAVEAMKLWEQIALATALTDQRFDHLEIEAGRRPRQAGGQPEGGATPPPPATGETPPATEPPRTGGARLGLMPVYAHEGDGLLVESVGADSPAAKAGILAGDVILKLGGEAITKDTLRAKLAERNPGDVVEVVLTRDGVEQTISVTLGVPVR